MSSSCSVRSCDDSALARTIVENGVPVDEYVSSSTPVIVAPTAIGNDDLTWVHLRLCSTIDFRSPWASAPPSSVTNFFCNSERGRIG